VLRAHVKRHLARPSGTVAGKAKPRWIFYCQLMLWIERCDVIVAFPHECFCVRVLYLCFILVGVLMAVNRVILA
jgi:hypothetical protein